MASDQAPEPERILARRIMGLLASSLSECYEANLGLMQDILRTVHECGWAPRASPLPPPGSAAEAEMVERAAEGVWIELATDFHWHEACADPAHAEGVRWARKVARAALRAAFAKGGESDG